MPQTTQQAPKAVRCKNCALGYKGYYCPRCGQSADNKRFTFRNFFLDSLIQSLELEGGAFGTLKQLTLNPGALILGYVQGKRIGKLNPARFLFISGAIATFISLRYTIFEVGQNDILTDHQHNIPAGFEKIGTWYWENFELFWPVVNEYTTLVNILSIPIFALFSYLLFVKAAFNYVENIVLNTYIVCMQLLLLIVFIPFLEIFPSTKSLLISVYSLLTIAYNLWVYMCFYKKVNFHGFLLSAIANALAYVGVFIAAHITYYVLVQVGVFP